MFKRILVLLMLLVVVNGFAEVKLDSLIWLDSEAYVDTNQTFFVDKGGAFYIGRAYVNLRGDIGKDWFGNKITGRLTVDFSKPATPVKYAYFDWKFADFLVLSGGLMKSEFGYLTYWEYPLPVKALGEVDKNLKPTASADFGMGISGKLLPIEGLTKNLIYYNIQILNGEGYEKLYKGDTTPPNDTFASHYTLVLSPIDGVKVGGTYRLNPRDYEQSRDSRAGLPLNVSQNAYAIYASANNIAISEDFKIPVDFLVEYIAMDTKFDGYKNTNSTSTTNYTVSGYAYSIMLGYTLFDAVTPYVRYDMVDPDTSASATNDMQQILYIGANVKVDPKGNLVFKPLYQYYLMKDNKSDKNDWIIKLEVEYKLGFSIWQ